MFHARISARQHICRARYYAIARPSVRPSVCLSVCLSRGWMMMMMMMMDELPLAWRESEDCKDT